MKIYHIPAAPPLYTNTFLLVGENGLAAAVDPAAGAQEYLRLLEQEGARLTHILLTHGHYDHVGAVEELQRKTGAKVWLAYSEWLIGGPASASFNSLVVTTGAELLRRLSHPRS